MNILIKNGTLITAAETFRSDILITGEKIALIGQELKVAADQIIDASGKLVMPGGVDPHTHFDLPMFETVSSDDHYTGHKAAAFGGTTTVMDFVSLDSETLGESVAAWRKKAEKAAIDYSFHMNLTRFDERIAAEIPALKSMGITTLKVFTAYNRRLRLTDESIFRALRIARENGMLVMAHCENGDVIDTLVPEALAAGHTTPEWHALTRPAWGGIESTMRMAAMAAEAKARVYVLIGIRRRCSSKSDKSTRDSRQAKAPASSPGLCVYQLSQNIETSHSGHCIARARSASPTSGAATSTTLRCRGHRCKYAV